MDGKLTGRLSPRRQLTGRLSFSVRDAPGLVLIPKAVSENGLFRAAEDGADGYTMVTVEVPPTAQPLVPHAYDLTGGYTRNGIWTVGGDTVNYSDVYAVEAGTAYLLMLGSIVGSRFRSMFSKADTSTTKVDITGRQITNLADPPPYAYATFNSTEAGFVTITKDNAGWAGLKTYVFRIADLASEE